MPAPRGRAPRNGSRIWAPRWSCSTPRAPWEKPCGGGLTASAVDNAPDLRDILRRAQRIGSVRLESDRSRVEVPLERPLYVLSRVVLDRWQLDRARSAGAGFEQVSVQRITRHPGDGWWLETARGGRFGVRFLVGADGAASRVRRAVAPTLTISLAPARVAFVPGAGASPTSIGLRFFPRTEGYAWDFPRPDHRSIGVGVESGTWARARMDAEVDRYRAELDRCGCVEAERAGAVIGIAARPLGRRYMLLGRSDYALLGDAAGFADPATGEGIQNAIRSADLLARSFERDGDFAGYARAVQDELERELAMARWVKRMLYRWSTACRLIDLAASRRWAYAFVSAVVNGANAHDPSPLQRLPGEWRRAAHWQADLKEPEPAARCRCR